LIPFLKGIEGLSLPFQPAATCRIALPGRFELHRLLKLAGEFSDLGGDVSTQELESGDGCQRD
jgi:hypothetical protein